MSGTVTIHGKEYKTVALRVHEFREDDKYAGWAITTEMVSFQDDDCVILATVSDAEGAVKATGLAHEVRGSTNINKTSHVENCETSAIGRALACLGLAGTEYASADEVVNAINNQAIKAATEKLVNHGIAVRENLQVILAIKESLGTGDFDEVAAYFYHMPENKSYLNQAPTKGGIFTTRELELLKSDEYNAVRAAYYKEQNQ